MVLWKRMLTFSDAARVIMFLAVLTPGQSDQGSPLHPIPSPTSLGIDDRDDRTALRTHVTHPLSVSHFLRQSWPSEVLLEWCPRVMKPAWSLQELPPVASVKTARCQMHRQSASRNQPWSRLRR